MAPAALAQKRSRRQNLLSTAARGRNIDLILLSTGMQRRTVNTSNYHKKEDRMSWRIEWRCKELTETVDGNNENQTLRQLLYKTKTFPIAREEKEEEENTKWVYLLVKARCPANHPSLYHLGTGALKLRELLTGKSIVEHPVIHVVAAANEAQYLKDQNIAVIPLTVAARAEVVVPVGKVGGVAK